MRKGGIIFSNHPNGFKPDFHNNGKGDTFIITLDELLQQLSKLLLFHEKIEIVIIGSLISK
jgi:hypothetical protein